MKETNQNRILGAFGIALIAIGLLGYTGVLAKVQNRATLIIDANSTVTDITANTDSLTTLPLSPYDYWQDGMSNWTNLSEGTEINADKPVYFMVTWMNNTDSTVIGHASLTVTLPDGSTISPSADEGQDSSAGPSQGHMVSFENIQGMQGNYSLDFQITGEYGTTPAGYFTINGENVTEDATITLHTHDLTFVFHPTQNASAIDSVAVGISDPISGGTGESGHQLDLAKQADGTYEATDTLSNGEYSINGKFFTDAGDKFVAMSIRDFTIGNEEGNKLLWFAPLLLGFVVVGGVVSRQYLS